MSVPLPDLAKRLLDAPTYVTVTTINPDGSPHSSIVWVTRDGDDILMSTTKARRKARNLARDPRASVCFFDPENPYQYVEVRGRVTMTEEGGRALIDELSMKYSGRPWQKEPADTVRVVCRLMPDKVITR
ncbi:MAG TPA: PPOX class F420-dependent oxidoreductase [Micromonosporaceae bacterium]